MNAAQVMTRTVVAISPDAPLSQAVRLMLDARISGLPVLDASGRPVGMLTEGDLLHRVETGTDGDPPGWLAALFTPGRLAEHYVRTHGRRVAEVMTPNVVTVTEGTSLDEVADLMQRRHFKRIPVVRDGRVVGIVGRADLLRALAERLRPSSEAPSDSAIRARLAAELAGKPWAHRRSVTIEVAEGVVRLAGTVFDPREREAMQVAAENIPGVTRIENHVLCVEPVTGALMLDPDSEFGAAGLVA